IKLDDLVVLWNKKRLININHKFAENNHPYFFHLEQSVIESYLNNFLENYSVKIERGCELIGLEQSSNNVTVIVKNKLENIYQEKYEYVVGCDGGLSTMRNLLGVSCEEEKYGAYFVLMD